MGVLIYFDFHQRTFCPFSERITGPLLLSLVAIVGNIGRMIGVNMWILRFGGHCIADYCVTRFLYKYKD